MSNYALNFLNFQYMFSVCLLHVPFSNSRTFLYIDSTNSEHIDYEQARMSYTVINSWFRSAD